MARAYATVAKGGVAYEPRLVKTVLTSVGRPALDENGHTAVPDQPKIRGNLLSEFSQAQLDLVRNGLWKVVNEGGGTGSRAKLKGVTVAGKTGTAQATDRGKEENIGWFCAYAPYEKPRYAVCVMIQAGEHGGHGGTIASPVAGHILEQIFAMDEGSYEVPLASLAPAHNPHPFAAVTAVDYKNAEKFTLTEESSDNAGDRAARPDMGDAGARPDIRPEADEAGKVKSRPKPAPQKRDTRNIFEKLFGIGRKPAPAPPGNRAPTNPFRPGGR
jgi:penicillin-binding protein 2